MRSRPGISQVRRATGGGNSTGAQELLKAVNDATVGARNLYLTLLGIAFFVAVVTGGLTPENLLRDGSVPLPLIERTLLPLSSFYLVAPWLIVFVHAELLIHLAALARKLKVFDDAVADKTDADASRLRLQLANFPFSQWLTGGISDIPLRAVQGFIVWITIVLLPLFVLVFAQIGFLSYQDEVITWSQRASVVADVVLLTFFWPNIVAPQTSRWSWWSNCWRRFHWRVPKKGERVQFRIALTRGGSLRLACACALATWVAMYVALIPHEPWEYKLIQWNKAMGGTTLFVDSGNTTKFSCFPLISEVVVDYSVRRISGAPVLSTSSGTTVLLPYRMTVLCPTAILFHSRWPFRRTLTISDRVLIGNTVPPEALAKIAGTNAAESEQALARVEGLDLRRRTLRFADFLNTRLHKADLRHADLQGSWFERVELQGSNLRSARLDGAVFLEAQLPGATLADAGLEGAHFKSVQLQGADFTGARIQGARFYSAKLQGAQLSSARLQGALFSGSEIQGANLSHALLNGATLESVQLQGANFYNADLRGALVRLSTWELNILNATRWGRWSPSEMYSTLSDLSKRLWRLPWFPDIEKAIDPRGDIKKAIKAGADWKKAIEALAGRDSAILDPKTRSCVKDERLLEPMAENQLRRALHFGCDKAITEKFVVEYAGFLAGLACDPDSDWALAAARQWAHRYLGEPAAAKTEGFTEDSTRIVLRTTFAQRMLDSGCVGRVVVLNKSDLVREIRARKELQQPLGSGPATIQIAPAPTQPPTQEKKP